MITKRQGKQVILKTVAAIFIIACMCIQQLYAQSNNGGIKESRTAIPITGTADQPNSLALTTGKVSINDYSTYPESQAQQTKNIKNIISFGLIEESDKYINADFNASVTLNIEYGHNSLSTTPVQKTFNITYKKASGQKFDAEQYFSFDGFEYVKVTVLNPINAPVIGSLDTRDILIIKNKMEITRFLQLPSSVLPPQVFNHTVPTLPPAPDHVTVNWEWNFNTGNNATQLEWVWLEDEMAEPGFVPTDITQIEKLFLNNASRVDLTYDATTYDIPLLYDGVGKLFYRIRALENKPLLQFQTSGNWEYSAQRYCSFSGHNNSLNWQATTSFAEDGKRKSVIQYYDGSLRGRQTVTKDNSTNTVVTAETMYDREGRAVIQILPTPGISNIISYQKNLNMFNGQANDEDPSNIFDLQPMAVNVNMQLNPNMGTSQYYSPLNPNTAGANKNIPDAEGYPYTITKFTPDATGRVMAQSGVGAAHQLGTGHETKYFYGTPSQEELDGLFGTEVGNFTHYSKNMVRDANGQVSISYVDMHGRTIATALAGECPDNLLPLDNTNPQNYPGQAGSPITRNLIDNNTNLIKDNSIESVSTLLVAKDNTAYTFDYGLTNLKLQLANCPAVTPANLCYDCLYDLEIAIVNDDGESTPLIRKYTNINLGGNSDDDCSTPAIPFAVMPGITGNEALAADITTANGVTTISFPKILNVGSYTVRKTLSINEASFQKYKDLYLSKALCKTEQQLIDSVYNVLLTVSGCNTSTPVTCQSCKDALGTPATFQAAYLLNTGITNPSAQLIAEIQAAYNTELANCNKLCTNVSQSLPTIRQMMLQDMVPFTGQYATETAVPGATTMHDKYNIFTTTSPAGTWQPFYKNPVKVVTGTKVKDYYYNDQAAIDDAVHPNSPTGLYSYLDGLSKNDFAAQFNNTWLTSLLPHHPEYARLVYAEDNLTPSYNWINEFSLTDVFATAQTNGYLNPVAIDPFAAINPSFVTQMNQQINNYQGSGYSLWQIARGDVECKTISDDIARKACYLQNNDPAPYAGFTAAENEQAWQRFRDLYTAKRNDFVNQFIAETVPMLPATDETDLLAQKFRLWFPRNSQQIATQSGDGGWPWWPADNGNGGPAGGGPVGDPTGGTGSTPPAQTYDGRCSSYINRWKTTLLQCPTILNHLQKDQIIAEITTALQQVCVKGSDPANPYGASNVKPSTPANTGYRSFEEVIDAKLAQYSISRDLLCNPFVMEWPKPYGKNPPITESGYTGTLDSCTCEQFAKIKIKAQQNNVNPANLQLLNVWLLAQYGDTLTADMFAALQQCSSGPACDCNNLQNVINLYYLAYPNGGFDSCTGTPAHLVVSSRTGNTPAIYAASIDIEFVPDFENPLGDNFETVISGTGSCDTITNCHNNFTNFFNTHYGYNPPFTWVQIDSIYNSNCGYSPSVCGIKDYSCENLQRVACKFRAQSNWGAMCSNGGPGVQAYFPSFFNNYFHNTVGLSWAEIEVIYQNSCVESYFWPFDLATLLCSTNTVLNCSQFTCDTINWPIVLQSPLPKPRFLDCGYNLNNTRCITCAQLSTYTAEFKTQQFATGAYNYSNAPHFYASGALTAQQVKENILYAKFINYRTGFQYGWLDYAQAAGNSTPACNLNNYNSNSGAIQTVICGTAKPLTDATDWPQPPAPCQRVYTMAINITQEIIKQRKETLLAEFENAYRQKCLTTANVETFIVNYTTSEYHYTLYYYDQAGNLVKTVPPKGARPNFAKIYTDQIKLDRDNNVFNPRPHLFTTEYRYNSLNQVVAQKTPDAGISHFWYDKLGRLVVSQNAKQQLVNNYSYTLYDALGRITEVGQKPQTTLMTQPISQNNTDLNDWINTSGGTKEEITRTVYDLEYDVNIYTQLNLRNRVSYTTVTGLDGQPFYAATFYSYDIHGNVDVLKQNYNQLEGLATADKNKTITYEYDLISGKVNRVNYQAGLPDAFYHRYDYDAENRLTKVQTSRDDIKWETDAQYNYYKHGPLSRSVLGQQQVQGMDYAYTLQGWLKGVNTSAITPSAGGNSFDIGEDGIAGDITVARDIFGYALHYFDNGAAQYDYKPIGAGTNTFARPNTAGTQFKSLFNGNIGAMTVNNGGLKSGPPASTNSDVLFNRYWYDQLNRIVSMNVYKGLNENTNLWTPVSMNDYQEQVNYDPNGNIATYQRNGDATRLSMDNMKYWYYYYDNGGVKQQYDPTATLPGNVQSFTNQLAKVVDIAPDAGANYSNYNDIKTGQTGNNYTYDAIGNLVSDKSENIYDPLVPAKPMIEWTVYGKISSITKTNGITSTPVSTITYGYDASGNRISKKLVTSAGTNITVYVRDASGNVMSVYEKAAAETFALQTETHLYGSSRLGQAGKLTVLPIPGTLPVSGETTIMSTFTRGEKVFELSNHLGNVLVTVTDRKIAFDANTDGTIDYCEADVATANDYYPFGMQLPGRKYQASPTSKYRYSINGQEKESELNENITTAQFWEYDSRIVRRWNIDPKFKKFPNESPYLVFHANPILFSDPNGDDPPKNFKEHKNTVDGQSLFLPKSAKIELFTEKNSGGNKSLIGKIRAYNIGKTRFVSTNENNRFKGYGNWNNKGGVNYYYKNPDISVGTNPVLGASMDVTFNLTNSGSSSSGQAIQIVTTNLPVKESKYKANGMNGFVDGGVNSPGYVQNGNKEVGYDNPPGNNPFIIGYFKNSPIGRVSNNGGGNVTVNVHDDPGAQTNPGAIVNFQTIIISTNFHGSGQNIIMGVYNWGFRYGGSSVAINNGQTHTTNTINFTDVNSESLKILSTDYPHYEIKQ